MRPFCQRAPDFGKSLCLSAALEYLNSESRAMFLARASAMLATIASYAQWRGLKNPP